VITVQGQQFNWTFDYNEGGRTFTSAQLYVPKDESVRFNVKTRDVLHDFWVPAWRMKIDAVPGITTHYRITPIRYGTYPVVCAELCGLGHAFMRNTAHVLPKAQFAAWVKRMEANAAGAGAAAGSGSGAAAGSSGSAAAPAADGKTLFTKGESTTGATACGACHRLSDAGTTGGVGPDLDTVLKGKDAAFIKQSIEDPNAVIAKGFDANIMPGTYSKLLNAGEIDALVKYLEEVAAK
jgi:cytochrome c oxidase subunit 2